MINNKHILRADLLVLDSVYKQPVMVNQFGIFIVLNKLSVNIMSIQITCSYVIHHDQDRTEVHCYIDS